MKRFCYCFIFLAIITLSSVFAADPTNPNSLPGNQNHTETREVKTGFFNFLKRILFGTDNFGNPETSEVNLLSTPEINKADQALGFRRLLNDADKQTNEIDRHITYLNKTFNKTNLNNASEVLKKLNFKLADLKFLSASLRDQLNTPDFDYDGSSVLLKDHLLVDLKDFRSNLFIFENLENYSKSIKSFEKDLSRLKTKLDFLTKQKKDTKEAEALAKDLFSNLEDFKDYLSSSDELDYEKIFNFESSLEKNKNALSDELFILQGYIKKDDLSRIERGEGGSARAFNPSNLGASVLRILYR